MNAPLKQLDEPAAQAADAELPPGTRRCPSCRGRISESDEICVYCKAIVTPDGVYRGPRENAPGAVASLVYGILGLFVCGVIFGLLAISKAREARQIIASDPRYGGEGLASAGRVLGILDLVLWGLFLVSRLAQLGS